MDVLAPGVVRVDTDTDHTPIGACWGRDLPEGWGWRRYEHEDWQFDVVPLVVGWVQCRPPASPQAGDDPAEDALWQDIESAIHIHMGHDGQSDETNDWVHDLMGQIWPHIQRALNAAESSTTRSGLVHLADCLRRVDEAREAFYCLPDDAHPEEIVKVAAALPPARDALVDAVRDALNAAESSTTPDTSEDIPGPEIASSQVPSSPVVDREPEEADNPLTRMCSLCHMLMSTGTCNHLLDLGDGRVGMKRSEWESFVTDRLRLRDIEDGPSVSPVPQPDPGQETP